MMDEYKMDTLVKWRRMRDEKIAAEQERKRIKREAREKDRALKRKWKILSGGVTRYAKYLATKLGNPDDWVYNDKFNDLEEPVGVCLCGKHGIRYEFILDHKFEAGKTTTLGSQCIKHFYLLNAEAGERMAEGMQDMLISKDKARRELIQKNEIEKLSKDYELIVSRFHQLYRELRRKNQGMAPKELWKICDSRLFKIPEHACGITDKFDRLRDKKKALVSEINRLEKAYNIGDYTTY